MIRFESFLLTTNVFQISDSNQQQKNSLDVIPVPFGTSLVVRSRSATSVRLPHRLSSNHDPLFEYRQWKANLRILDIAEVKTVPYVPLSHPFVERLVGTIRRELLDHILFWNAGDLERKLEHFKDYYN